LFLTLSAKEIFAYKSYSNSFILESLSYNYFFILSNCSKLKILI
jgi:hypothetical protein